jgi:hypothetical protein
MDELDAVVARARTLRHPDSGAEAAASRAPRPGSAIAVEKQTLSLLLNCRAAKRFSRAEICRF